MENVPARVTMRSLVLAGVTLGLSMRSMTIPHNIGKAADELQTVTSTSAQTVQYCPTQYKDVCYSVNVPDQTAASGSGDVFFQIQGPSTKQWIGLGQGSQMAGSNIFVAYASASGRNVTLSPRVGRGYVQPRFDSTAQVSLLEGSGIADGRMTVNVRCMAPFFHHHLTARESVSDERMRLRLQL